MLPDIVPVARYTYIVPVQWLAETDGIRQCGINPFTTAVPFWGQTTHILSSFPQNGTGVVKGLIVSGAVLVAARTINSIVPASMAGAYRHY